MVWLLIRLVPSPSSQALHVMARAFCFTDCSWQVEQKHVPKHMERTQGGG